MRSLRYLNSVLTVLAILLTLQLWTMWTQSAAPSRSAAWLDVARPAHAAGLPNSAMQRKQTNDLLKQLIRKTEELNGLFKSGRARVRVEQAASKKPDKPEGS